MEPISIMKAGAWPSDPIVEDSRSRFDSDHFQRLWSTARVPLASFLACFLPQRSMVEDCLQEVALLAWQKAPKDRGKDEFWAYCMGCARLVSKGAIRKQRIGRLHFLAPDVAISLAENVSQLSVADEEGDQRIQALRKCVESLDPVQRELLVARYSSSGVDALKHEAQKRSRSLESVYKQLERLRTALRGCVEKNIKQMS